VEEIANRVFRKNSPLEPGASACEEIECLKKVSTDLTNQLLEIYQRMDELKLSIDRQTPESTRPSRAA
jgi:hypothetical protein